MNRPPVEPSSAGLPAVGAAAGAPPWPWVRLVVGSLCQTLLAMLVFFALWAALPALLGWQPTTVSSGSMMPRLRVGDVAVARPLDRAPALDQVLLFDDPDHPGKLRLHRFVRVDDQGRMITRGDANTSDDSSPDHHWTPCTGWRSSGCPRSRCRSSGCARGAGCRSAWRR